MWKENVLAAVIISASAKLLSTNYDENDAVDDAEVKAVKQTKETKPKKATKDPQKKTGKDQAKAGAPQEAENKELCALTAHVDDLNSKRMPLLLLLSLLQLLYYYYSYYLLTIAYFNYNCFSVSTVLLQYLKLVY